MCGSALCTEVPLEPRRPKCHNSRASWCWDPTSSPRHVPHQQINGVLQHLIVVLYQGLPCCFTQWRATFHRMNMSTTLQKCSDIAMLFCRSTSLVYLWYCTQETFCWSQSRSASDGCFLWIRTCLQEPSTFARGEPEQFRLCWNWQKGRPSCRHSSHKSKVSQ